MPINPTAVSPSVGTTSGIAERLADLQRQVNNLTSVRTVIGDATLDGGRILVPGTVGTASIAAGSITAALIQADAINSSHIQAGTIQAGDIAANTITSAQIAAHTISALEIVAGTITATEIATGTITASKLSVTQLSAITADMGSLTAGTITGGTFRTSASDPKVQMDSTGIFAHDSLGITTFKADATTGKIITLAGLGGNNMLANSSAERSDANTGPWFSLASTLTSEASSDVQHGARRFKTVGTATGAIGQGQVLLVKAGATYTISGYMKHGGTARPCYTVVNWYDSTPALISSSAAVGMGTNSGTWSRGISNTVVAPAGATTGHFYFYADGISGDTHYWDALQVEEGQIMTGYAPMADEILVGQVQGGGGAAHIAPGTIIGGDIAANTITANRLTVSTLSAITADLGTITAGTITGATIQTASSDPRIKLTSTGLKSYETGGTLGFSLTPDKGLDLTSWGYGSTTPASRMLRWVDESDPTKIIVQMEAINTGTNYSIITVPNDGTHDSNFSVEVKGETANDKAQLGATGGVSTGPSYSILNAIRNKKLAGIRAYGEGGTTESYVEAYTDADYSNVGVPVIGRILLNTAVHSDYQFRAPRFHIKGASNADSANIVAVSTVTVNNGAGTPVDFTTTLTPTIAGHYPVGGKAAMKSTAGAVRGDLIIVCSPADLDGNTELRHIVAGQAALYQTAHIQGYFNLDAGTTYTLTMKVNAVSGTWVYYKGAAYTQFYVNQ